MDTKQSQPALNTEVLSVNVNSDIRVGEALNPPPQQRRLPGVAATLRVSDEKGLIALAPYAVSLSKSSGQAVVIIVMAPTN